MLSRRNVHLRAGHLHASSTHHFTHAVQQVSGCRQKISMSAIRDCLPVILGPLTDIINNSFITSTSPDPWKSVEVIPLLKEEDRDHEEASNNRPLSLLNVASMICERVGLQQFSSHLQCKGRLCSHQSGNEKSLY